MRRLLLIGLTATLTACSAAPHPIPVQPTIPPAVTIEAQIAYQAAQQPDRIYLPTARTTPTPQPASAIWLPTPTAPPATIPVAVRPAGATLGQPVAAWGWQLRCVGSESAPDSLTWSSEGHKLLSVGTWAIVLVEMTNTQATPQTIVGADFVVRDTRFRTYRATNALGEADYSSFRGGQRLGTPVLPGATARFYLVFDVAKDAQGLRMIFTAQRPASDRFEASFDLGR